eukprot:scaffold234561_cov30-Tisochrysis_lutea.AAC.1
MLLTTHNAPSLKTSPRCPPQPAQRSSEPRSTAVSELTVSTPSSPFANEGHPVPDSNFCSASNSGVPQPAQTNVPARFSFTSGEEFGGSVPPCRRMKYWPLESAASQSFCCGYPATRSFALATSGMLVEVATAVWRKNVRLLGAFGLSPPSAAQPSSAT